MNTIRQPAVAGMFYAAGARELAQDVRGFLAEAKRGSVAAMAPKAIIAPHAGYIYSGPIAATAYAQLERVRSQVTKVVLLGPVHRVPVRGLALPAARVLATPLGEIKVDAASIERISKMRQVTVSDAAHALEHSLEVHLPFLQAVLDDFSIVPLAVGDASPEEVAEVLEALWGGPETLIVVSSDLSHYLSYTDAQAVDGATVQAILDLRSDISHDQACGGTPVNGLTLLARRRGLRAQLLDVRNSGDTAGDRNRVVGYGSFAFYEGSSDEESLR